jgi:CrcB protein
MLKYILLATGGAIGTILRYSMSGLTYRLVNSVFPWGTIVVNLTGSFAIGLLWGFFEINNISSNMRNFIFIGVLGGFTTFSTYALESLSLFRDGELKLAMTNLLISNICGLILVFAGFMLSKFIINLIK